MHRSVARHYLITQNASTVFSMSSMLPEDESSSCSTMHRSTLLPCMRMTRSWVLVIISTGTRSQTTTLRFVNLQPVATLPNNAQIAEKMHEYVTSTNNIFRYQSPYEVLLAKRYPGANMAVFNVWQLMSDIYDNPAIYFNGTQPANVTGFEHHCTPDQSLCTLMYNGTSSDSFMWYDELHPR